MKLAVQQQDSLDRLLEARILLDMIINEEAVPPAQDSLLILNLRGLFFVHLYACLEFSVNSAIQRVLTIIGTHSVQYRHYADKFYPVVMANHFMSVRAAGKENKWGTRVDFFEKFFSENVAAINSSVFYEDHQNIKVSTLKNIFLCLGIEKPFLPQMRYAGHIDNIADNRNAIAHGRRSPIDVAAGNRASDLKLKWEIVSETIGYLFSVLSDYVDELSFVQEESRSIYESS
jgi:hypothetical protein